MGGFTCDVDTHLKSKSSLEMAPRDSQMAHIALGEFEGYICPHAEEIAVLCACWKPRSNTGRHIRRSPADVAERRGGRGRMARRRPARRPPAMASGRSRR